MPLNRTTTRALAASVALVAAGGTVAGAAVFHIPVLGFGASNAGATATQFAQVAAVRPRAATKVMPRRVVKTRYVDQIVHHQSAWSGSSATTAASTAPAPAATAAPSHVEQAPTSTPPTMDPNPPAEPPSAEPPEG
ncbi:MAG TPA: hypothetical protein VIK61_01525, partial [Acidimicrobiia bacterium]